jgi:hypothetical protein
VHYSIKKCRDQTQRRISASGMAHNFVFDAILCLVCKWERSGEGGFLLYYYTSCCATVAVRR